MTDWTPSAVVIEASRGPHRVDAAVCWPLAVHATWHGDGWTITHVPTGLAIKRPWPTRAAAVQAAERILEAVPVESLARPDVHRDERLQAAVREVEVERVWLATD